MPVILSSALHAQLLAEARGALPRECCGLLFGSEAAIVRAAPATNVAADPLRAFEIDPAALIAAERASRTAPEGSGARLIGHYHSHPGGLPVPSAYDAAASAGDGRLWLIVTAQAIGAWRAVPGAAHLGAFDPVALQVTG